MSFLGIWRIDDLLTFYVNTHDPATAGEIDADAVPGYRLYEDEAAAPILTGSMALLDTVNTTGFYSEQITLSAANGFEVGKSYAIRITCVVGGVTGVVVHTFQVELPKSGVVRQNTCQADGAPDSTHAVLDAGASANNDFYNGMWFAVVRGTGAGQLPRAITDYVGATTRVLLDPPLDTVLDNTSEFAIFV